MYINKFSGERMQYSMNYDDGHLHSCVKQIHIYYNYNYYLGCTCQSEYKLQKQCDKNFKHQLNINEIVHNVCLEFFSRIVL